MPVSIKHLGIALGIEIAQKAQQITGLPTMFVADVTGNYGGVAWLTAFTDSAEMERAQLRLNGDQSFAEMIDTHVPGAYTDQPGQTTQRIFRRII